MSFAYFFVFPVMFGFFAGYTPAGVQMMTDIDKYLSFVLTMFIAFGITFEMPVVVIVLVRMRVVSPREAARDPPVRDRRRVRRRRDLHAARRDFAADAGRAAVAAVRARAVARALRRPCRGETAARKRRPQSNRRLPSLRGPASAACRRSRRCRPACRRAPACTWRSIPAAIRRCARAAAARLCVGLPPISSTTSRTSMPARSAGPLRCTPRISTPSAGISASACASRA